MVNGSLSHYPHYPDMVLNLQAELYEKARSNSKERFKHLKKLLLKDEILHVAWNNLNRSTKALGMDCLTLQQVEADGLEEFFQSLKNELKKNKYRSDNVRKISIPKDDGKQRNLGIMTVKDKLVQSAMKLVLEPIFEASFENSSFGFRPCRSTRLASLEVYKWLELGNRQVLKGDIMNCFDSIPHDKLMSCLKERIHDKDILLIINSWLKAGIIDAKSVIYPEKGVLQGGIISPLLVNIYLDQFDKHWIQSGIKESQNQAPEYLVRYADDFLVMSKEWVDLQNIRQILQDLELELNTEKTYISNISKGFEFLGFYFRERSDIQYPFGKIEILPTDGSVQRVCASIEGTIKSGQILDKSFPLLLEEIRKPIDYWLDYYKHTDYFECLETIEETLNRNLQNFLNLNPMVEVT